MPVHRINPLEDLRWTELINRHPRASIFHTRGWLESLRQSYKYDPIVFTTSAPGQELRDGIVFCSIRSWLTGSRLVSLPFSDHCEPLLEEPEKCIEILDEVGHKISRKEWDYIEIRPLHSKTTALLERGRFGKGNSFHFHVLNLEPSLEDLFGSFNKSTVQRKIRRAEREGLTYKEGRSADLLAEFYKLFLLTRRRHHSPPQPLVWFHNLAQFVGDGLKVRVASIAGRPIASIITLSHNGTMVYKYGCSDFEFGSLGGTALLFWKAIQDAKHQECHTFDFGRSDNDNTGLIRFKDNWGTSNSTLTYWRHPASAIRVNRPGSLQKALTKQVFARIPDRMLIALGKLAYRHIG